MKNNIWKINSKKFPKKKPIEEQLKFLLSYAILAPSSHNTQPWLFSIDKNNINIIPNFNRSLPYSDRAYREIYISLGTVAANLEIAGKYLGLKTKITYLPDTEIDPVAIKLTFNQDKKQKTNNTEVENLFKEITNRKTIRFKNEKTPVSKDIINQIIKTYNNKEPQITLITKDKTKDIISELMYQAIYKAYNDKVFKLELSNWLRPINTEKEDGIPVYDAGIPSRLTKHIEKIIQKVPAKTIAKQDANLVKESTTLLIISALSDNKTSWLKAGLQLQYIWLFLTHKGIHLTPMAGIIESTPEQKELGKVLFNNEKTPVFFARIGYIKENVPTSPRLPVQSVILE